MLKPPGSKLALNANKPFDHAFEHMHMCFVTLWVRMYPCPPLHAPCCTSRRSISLEETVYGCFKELLILLTFRATCRYQQEPLSPGPVISLLHNLPPSMQMGRGVELRNEYVIKTKPVRRIWQADERGKETACLRLRCSEASG